MNYVLDCSNFEEHIVRTIPKAENTSEHKYNQSNTINNTAKARRLEQLKQYSQQFVQDKSGGGYIASITYTKTRDLSKKPGV